MSKKLVRCKTCGYVMPEGVYHACPACGVPEKMFEPWEDKIPAGRRRVLDLHIHPVVVHAPQALAFLMLLIAAVYTVLTQAMPGTEASSYLGITLKVLAVLLPVMVAGGFLTGLLDGWYRYKTVTTTLLVRKMTAGAVFFVVSVLMLVLAWLPGFAGEPAIQIGFIALNLVAFACTAVLGLWGASLVGGIMPGPFVKKKPAARAD